MADEKPIISNEFKNMLPGFARYGILVFIYLTIYFYRMKDSIQFILYIILLICIFFTILFFYMDIIGNNLLMDVFKNVNDMTLNNNILIKVFISLVFITLILQFSSVAIIIAVFDYGKEQTNGFYTPQLTSNNKETLKFFSSYFTIYTTIMLLFTFAVAVSKMRDSVEKTLILNMSLIVPSLILIFCSVYGTILSVEFLNVRKDKRALYK